VDAAETRRHIDQVSERLRAAAPPDLRDELLRAAAVHEDRDHVPADVAPIVLGFGEVWQPGLDLDAYVGRHRDHLRALLLFELAHEGAATTAMRSAAERGGIADEFSAWERTMSPTGA
jgi:hypothetical protein